MTLTIEEIITEIISEVGQDTSDSTLVALMLVFFKSGMREFPAFARDRLLIVQEELSLAQGEQSLDLTTLTNGFLKETAVWYVNASGSRIPILQPPYRRYFDRIFTTSGSGKPMYYVINGKTMQFDRKSDASIQVGIRFFKEISDISTSDTFFGDERTVQACKHLCKKGYYLDYEEDERKHLLHEKDANNIIFQLESDYEEQEQGGHIGDSDGGNINY